MRVVAWGLGAFVGALVVLGVHAVQARSFADRRADVGVFRAMGASAGWMRGRLLLEAVPMAFAAGAVGAVLGNLFDRLLRSTGSVVLFGHEIEAVADLPTFLVVVAAVVATSVLSDLLLLERALRERPMESVRERRAVEPLESLEAILRG